MAETEDGGEKPRKPRRVGHSTHAREVAPPVAERVATIRRLLTARAWDSERAAELAEVWQVSEVTIRVHAAEAQRQLEALLDQDQVRHEVAGLLAEATERARAEKKDADAAKALTTVAKLKAEIGGLTRKQATPPGKAPAPTPTGAPTAPTEGGKVLPWKKKA